MHVIAPHVPAISLFSQAGLVRRFASKLDVLTQLGYRWITANVGEHFCVAAPRTRPPYAETGERCTELACALHSYVLRDDAGKSLTSKDFRGLLPKRKTNFSLYGTWAGVGPVPRTGRTSRHCYFRHPRTHALRRIATSFPEYDEPAIRGKRAAAVRYTAADEIRRADTEDRSWKRYRKVQWKPVL